jgi:hypothetical protein
MYVDVYTHTHTHTHFKKRTLEFKTRNYNAVNTMVSYDNYFISNTNNVKCLGLTIDTICNGNTTLIKSYPN